jgi:hypothetical protein
VEEEDAEIEDIFKERPKKIKSGRKGKRVELDLIKDLNERFGSVLSSRPQAGRFSRSVGSGNRWGQRVQLSKAASDTYSGDIVCPEGFLFVLESKGGYNDIDLCTAFSGRQAELDSFLKQVSDDSKRCGRMPLLLWKKDRKPRLAFLKSEDLKGREFAYMLRYGQWTAISMEDLMSLEDDFFFSPAPSAP